MNYHHPDRLEQLAAAYVLGTLRGPARNRFDRLCVHSDTAAAALRRWEDRLMPMLPVLMPVTPSKKVWGQIERRVRIQSAAPGRGVRTWRWAVAGALALSLIVGVSIRLLNPPLQSVAAIGQEAGQPVWRVSRTTDSDALTLVALRAVQTNPQMAYELWALPRDGKPPVSLGLLPRNGRIERKLTTGQRAGLVGSDRVAVSLEPPLGSPTGQPTGPILYVVDINRSG